MYESFFKDMCTHIISQWEKDAHVIPGFAPYNIKIDTQKAGSKEESD